MPPGAPGVASKQPQSRPSASAASGPVRSGGGGGGGNGSAQLRTPSQHTVQLGSRPLNTAAVLPKSLLVGPKAIGREGDLSKKKDYRNRAAAEAAGSHAVTISREVRSGTSGGHAGGRAPLAVVSSRRHPSDDPLHRLLQSDGDDDIDSSSNGEMRGSSGRGVAAALDKGGSSWWKAGGAVGGGDRRLEWTASMEKQLVAGFELLGPRWTALLNLLKHGNPEGFAAVTNGMQLKVRSCVCCGETIRFIICDKNHHSWGITLRTTSDLAVFIVQDKIRALQNRAKRASAVEEAAQEQWRELMERARQLPDDMPASVVLAWDPQSSRPRPPPPPPLQLHAALRSQAIAEQQVLEQIEEEQEMGQREEKEDEQQEEEPDTYPRPDQTDGEPPEQHCKCCIYRMEPEDPSRLLQSKEDRRAQLYAVADAAGSGEGGNGGKEGIGNGESDDEGAGNAGSEADTDGPGASEYVGGSEVDPLLENEEEEKGEGFSVPMPSPEPGHTSEDESSASAEAAGGSQDESGSSCDSLNDDLERARKERSSVEDGKHRVLLPWKELQKQVQQSLQERPGERLQQATRGFVESLSGRNGDLRKHLTERDFWATVLCHWAKLAIYRAPRDKELESDPFASMLCCFAAWHVVGRQQPPPTKFADMATETFGWQLAARGASFLRDRLLREFFGPIDGERLLDLLEGTRRRGAAPALPERLYERLVELRKPLPSVDPRWLLLRRGSMVLQLLFEANAMHRLCGISEEIERSRASGGGGGGGDEATVPAILAAVEAMVRRGEAKVGLPVRTASSSRSKAAERAEAAPAALDPEVLAKALLVIVREYAWFAWYYALKARDPTEAGAAWRMREGGTKEGEYARELIAPIAAIVACRPVVQLCLKAAAATAASKDQLKQRLTSEEPFDARSLSLPLEAGSVPVKLKATCYVPAGWQEEKDGDEREGTLPPPPMVFCRVRAGGQHLWQLVFAPAAGTGALLKQQQQQHHVGLSTESLKCLSSLYWRSLPRCRPAPVGPVTAATEAALARSAASAGTSGWFSLSFTLVEDPNFFPTIRVHLLFGFLILSLLLAGVRVSSSSSSEAATSGGLDAKSPAATPRLLSALKTAAGAAAPDAARKKVKKKVHLSLEPVLASLAESKEGAETPVAKKRKSGEESAIGGGQKTAHQTASPAGSPESVDKEKEERLALHKEKKRRKKEEKKKMEAAQHERSPLASTPTKEKKKKKTTPIKS